MSVSFKDFLPGEKGVFLGFEPGSKPYRSKLLAMGVTRGTEFTFINMAPLGDPVNLELRGFHLTLRKSEAQVIKVGKSHE